MASIRRLKKDIDKLFTMLINDCFYVIEYNPKVDAKAVMKLAEEGIVMHREFRERANHPDGKDNPVLVKRYYSQLISDLLDTIDKSLEALSTEIKKVS